VQELEGLGLEYLSGTIPPFGFFSFFWLFLFDLGSSYIVIMTILLLFRVYVCVMLMWGLLFRTANGCCVGCVCFPFHAEDD